MTLMGSLTHRRMNTKLLL
ncbi:hypothetical protein Gorai_003001 [Gossypium raimondii]|uniref:Uncharacterized protein n=1 Tax=Gossypium raimondii TaxID=29730 RepID=A0A7J8QMU7_GOSRA|nr:hypothetical protein [Gossypium raimondii]